MKKLKKFTGVATALVTPFRRDHSVDETALMRLVDFQIKNGVQALVPIGTTGESPVLSNDERVRIIEMVVRRAKGRVKVFAGTGTNNTAQSIENTILAKRLGADAALIVAPYYNKPTQEGFFQHYKAIAEGSDFPLIVYNVPGRTGSNIDAATQLRIVREIPNIIAIKEASGNMSQIMEVARKLPENVSLLSGDDALTLPMMSIGACGVISVVSNQVPKEISVMVEYCLKGKWKNALELHNQLLTLMNVNFIESNPIPVKAGLAIMGMIEEVYRLPLVPMKHENRAKVEAALKEIGVVRKNK